VDKIIYVKAIFLIRPSGFLQIIVYLSYFFESHVGAYHSDHEHNQVVIHSTGLYHALAQLSDYKFLELGPYSRSINIRIFILLLHAEITSQTPPHRIMILAPHPVLQHEQLFEQDPPSDFIVPAPPILRQTRKGSPKPDFQEDETKAIVFK